MKKPLGAWLPLRPQGIRPGVRRAIVRLEKPGALRFARTVAVEIERTRDDYPDL